MPAPRTKGWTLECDGGARGNPGPAAVAYLLLDPDRQVIESRAESIGTATNNIAEYRALIAGLEAAAGRKAAPLTVRMDSELVVRQMTGEYKVKHEGLKPLHAAARAAAARIAGLTFEAVPREQNARADRLVNDTLDRILGSESPR